MMKRLNYGVFGCGGGCGEWYKRFQGIVDEIGIVDMFWTLLAL